ncbi:MAG TPA: glycogen debranching N-terminal domain-containing protein, partial [Chloroflexota bacterium]
MLSDSVVLKENHIQMITDQLGDIPSADAANYGLYYYDTRHLSAFELRVNGLKPLYLSHTADRNYIATFQFVNPNMLLPDGTRVPRQTLSIRRTRFVDGRMFQERLGFFNCNHFAVDLEVTLSFECDFLDMFAVRGYVQQRLAGQQHTRFDQKQLTFSYVGRDKVLRHTAVKFDQAGEPLSAQSVLFRLHLEPHTPVSLSLYVRPSVGRARPLKAPAFDRHLESLARSYSDWDAACTRFETNNEYFDRSLLRQSRLDVRSLLEFDTIPANGSHPADKADSTSHIVPSAGIPWYAVPFGRDAIITALQTLVYNPEIAEGTLRFLAYHQGKKVNPATEEEPGKIFHEIRRGELANLREVPHLPYYGTVDATPLFVILFAETYKWTGSEQLYSDLLPHAMRAVEWCNRYGDADGDGYVEYQPRSEGGVLNHGWKDSWDSLQYEDGRVASTPAALIEVQGYVYRAKRELSDLLEQHGDTGSAKRLRS